MNIINDGYSIEIYFNDNFDAMTCEAECRLVLQFMPELYADMLKLMKEEKE